jgi:hypothetical protein
MPEFRDIKSLNAYIERQYIENFLATVGKEAFEILYHEVEVNWYGRMTPTDYDRTMQLLHSITCSPVKKINGEYQVRIYYDTDKIIPMDGTDGYPWTRHKSIIDGESSAEALPYYIEFGNGDSPIYQYEGTHPVQTTYDQLVQDSHLLVRFKELFEKRGIRCE